MCAWLVESFEPDARLTSVSIGYNIAQAITGGSKPAFLATLLVDSVGPVAPGVILTTLALVALTGLLCVAPPAPSHVKNSRAFEVEMIPSSRIDDDDKELI
jgi:hypothetical protein